MVVEAPHLHGGDVIVGVGFVPRFRLVLSCNADHSNSVARRPTTVLPIVWIASLIAFSISKGENFLA